MKRRISTALALALSTSTTLAFAQAAEPAPKNPDAPATGEAKQPFPADGKRPAGASAESTEPKKPDFKAPEGKGAPSDGAAAGEAPSGAAPPAGGTEPPGAGPGDVAPPPAPGEEAAPGASMETSAGVASSPPTMATRPMEAPEPDDGSLGTMQSFWNVHTGLRVGYLADPHFDPYASDNTLPQWTLGAGRTLLAQDRLSLAVGLTWDVGARSSDARGSDALIAVNRLTAPIEGRYHLDRWLYVFARLAPGVVNAHASVDDPSATSKLETSAWSFAADASAGTAFLIGSRKHPHKHVPRVWIVPEVGYMWAAQHSMLLEPSDRPDDDERPLAATDMGALALRGFFFRVGLQMSF